MIPAFSSPNGEETGQKQQMDLEGCSHRGMRHLVRVQSTPGDREQHPRCCRMWGVSKCLEHTSDLV